MASLGQQTGSLSDGLPPEIAKRVHPDWRKNESDYWAHRDSLLMNYRDQWIGFADGKVIASGKSPVEVFHSAQASGKHPFITCVGHENEPNRMRRSAFSYDQGYPNEPLPVVTTARTWHPKRYTTQTRPPCMTSRKFDVLATLPKTFHSRTLATLRTQQVA